MVKTTHLKDEAGEGEVAKLVVLLLEHTCPAVDIHKRTAHGTMYHLRLRQLRYRCTPTCSLLFSTLSWD